MSNVNKTVAAVVGAVVSVLVAFNVDVDEEVAAAIITVVTAAIVYLSPANKPA